MPSTTNLRKGAILAIVLVSYTMIVLDISIVITALPKIHRTLDFSPVALSWVQNAYLLTFGGLLLLGARAGDLIGRRRVFIIGLGLFTVASAAVGTAHSEAWLIAARALQGAGAAILAPSTLALLQTSFDEGPERTRAVSYYAAVAGVASTVGLVVGGIFAGWLSWRGGVFFNLPLGVGPMLAPPPLPPPPPPPPRPSGAPPPGPRRAAVRAPPSERSPRRSAWPPWCSASCTPPTPAGPARSRSPASPPACCCSPCSWSVSDGRRSRSCRCACSPAANAPGR